MIELAQFENVLLRGGFIVAHVRLVSEPFWDALGRPAAAETRISGRRFELLLRSDQSDEERSLSLYHEVLEAASVASPNPPASVIEFNEGDFERAARSIQAALGEATPENLNRMLQKFGFS
ncbi:MAG: hypothetical protein NTW03_19245 [Verrucomicrobia bacterium]|nr:hypothetical protein [Verrucomicrobiota bacterium]